MAELRSPSQTNGNTELGDPRLSSIDRPNIMLQSALVISGSISIGLWVNGMAIPSTVVQSPKAPTERTIVVESASGSSELSLAKHLRQIHAKIYTAYWCPHCHAQLSLFGLQASQQLERIECDPDGKDAKPELCKAAKIQSYPTWMIKGQRYEGTQSLNDLADASGYQGPRKFKIQMTFP
jgi:glutaredoxin